MKSFSVYISWIEYRRNKYIQVQKKYKDIKANDITEAMDIALAPHNNKMSPIVNMVWENH